MIPEDFSQTDDFGTRELPDHRPTGSPSEHLSLDCKSLVIALISGSRIRWGFYPSKR